MGKFIEFHNVHGDSIFIDPKAITVVGKSEYPKTKTAIYIGDATDEPFSVVESMDTVIKTIEVFMAGPAYIMYNVEPELSPYLNPAGVIPIP